MVSRHGLVSIYESIRCRFKSFSSNITEKSSSERSGLTFWNWKIFWTDGTSEIKNLLDSCFLNFLTRFCYLYISDIIPLERRNILNVLNTVCVQFTSRFQEDIAFWKIVSEIILKHLTIIHEFWFQCILRRG